MRKIYYAVMLMFLSFLWLQCIFADNAAYAAVYRNGPSGGYGGRDFIDRIQDNARVVEVRIKAGTFIDSVQFIHKSNTGKIIPLVKHGGDGGRVYSFTLNNNEYITGISGKYSRFVDSIRIHTSFGRTSQRYGGGGGYVNYSYKAPPGTEIIGFFGRKGALIDAIGILYRKR